MRIISSVDGGLVRGFGAGGTKGAGTVSMAPYQCRRHRPAGPCLDARFTSLARYPFRLARRSVVTKSCLGHRKVPSCFAGAASPMCRSPKDTLNRKETSLAHQLNVIV